MLKRTPSVLDVKDLTVKYGKLTVLDNVSLYTEPGEFVSLLGPSGSGKTTLLMSIAGFVSSNEGEITQDGTLINKVPPHRRNMGVVFQSYALFPHMSVRKNIGYPLSIRGSSRKDQDEKVAELLQLVRLEDYGDRKPDQLSGGQQQRVAIARALASNPSVLLMDEPLSALDKKLREEMLIEIRRIHDATGVTTIYVTHDQREALTISDRIAVMNAGKIAQLGSPQDIYNHPRSRFVADFIGEAAFLPATVKHGRITLPGGVVTSALPDCTDGKYLAVLRPEQMQIATGTAPPDAAVLESSLQSLYFQGETVLGSADFHGHVLPFRCLNRAASMGNLPAINEPISLHVDMSDITLVPEKG
ncbi:ABC transporter ATP-binding protein [Rhodobacteraceae bacterium LMO-12]|nr:ABC transporter ATP-binding protein [Rhodobacteraceae bacterium LMO-JJ12]